MKKLVHAFSDNDVLGMNDAVGIAALIKSGQISTAEVINAAIKRAEKVNPDLNAIVVKTYEQATNEPLVNAEGPLAGIPTFIKDNIPVKGVPTQLGTLAFKAKNEKKTGKYATQYLSTGMVSLGKSTLPEFGLICSTENPNWGITRNPWNTGYTTGGSSSGSAAMVAAGVVPIASANDGAGSIRIPASCCGLVGLKPSRGRLLHADGTNMLPLNLIVEGVVTRSVRDTATFYAEAEKYYTSKRMPAMGLVTGPSSKRLRILYFENLPEGSTGYLDADTINTIEANAKLLQSLGHQVDVIPFPYRIGEMTDDFLSYYGFLATLMRDFSSVLLSGKVDKTKLEPFTHGLSAHFKKNMFSLPASIRRIKKVGREFQQFFNDYDVIVTPVLAHAVSKIGYLSTELPYEEIRDRAVNFAPFTAAQNVTGAPAISLPMGMSKDGLPIGLQYIAPFGQDKLLLELAFELEAAQPWKFIYNS